MMNQRLDNNRKSSFPVTRLRGFFSLMPGLDKQEVFMNGLSPKSSFTRYFQLLQLLPLFHLDLMLFFIMERMW